MYKRPNCEGQATFVKKFKKKTKKSHPHMCGLSLYLILQLMLFLYILNDLGFFYFLCIFTHLPILPPNCSIPLCLPPLFSVVFCSSSVLPFMPSSRTNAAPAQPANESRYRQGDQEVWGHNCDTDTWRYIKTLVPLYDFI